MLRCAPCFRDSADCLLLHSFKELEFYCYLSLLCAVRFYLDLLELRFILLPTGALPRTPARTLSHPLWKPVIMRSGGLYDRRFFGDIVN